MDVTTEILTRMTRNIDKAIEQGLGSESIKIYPDKGELNTNQLNKKTLLDKISMKILKLEFKLDNTIKSKDIKYIVKEILPQYE